MICVCLILQHFPVQLQNPGSEQQLLNIWGIFPLPLLLPEVPEVKLVLTLCGGGDRGASLCRLSVSSVSRRRPHHSKVLT